MKTRYQHEDLIAELVPPWEVEPGELVWLHQALQAGFDKGQVGTLLDLANEGSAYIWRISTPRSRAITATRVVLYDDLRVLNAWLLGGVNILGQLGKLKMVLRALAKDHLCKVVQTNALPGLAKIYERSFGFKTDSISMIMEV